MDAELLHHHTVNAGKVRERDMSHGHVSVGAGTANWQPGGRFGHLFSSQVTEGCPRREMGSRLDIICRGY